MIEHLNVNNIDDLTPLIDFIHDESFELDRVSFNREASTVEIPFIKAIFEERQILSGDLIKKVKIPVVNCLLKVFAVDDCEILDTQEVGSYDMTWIEYDRDLKCLQITTGVPLDFRIFIREIEIKLYRDETPIDYKQMRVLGFTS